MSAYSGSTPPMSSAASITTPLPSSALQFRNNLHGENCSDDAREFSARRPPHSSRRRTVPSERRAPLPIAADNRGAAPDQNVPRGALREPPAAPVAQGADS
jgi:hypothetical protein